MSLLSIDQSELNFLTTIDRDDPLIPATPVNLETEENFSGTESKNNARGYHCNSSQNQFFLSRSVDIVRQYLNGSKFEERFVKYCSIYQ